MPPKFKKSLRDQLIENRTAERFWGAAFGKQLRADILPIKEKRVRTVKKSLTVGASESDVLKSVLALFRVHPGVAWCRRISVGAAENSAGQHVRFGFKGCSDIIGQMKDGRFLACEVKREKGGKVSEEQQRFIDTVLANNGVAGVARSVDEAMKILEEAK